MKLLIDTGAGVSIIRAPCIGKEKIIKKTSVRLNGVSGNICVLGKCNAHWILEKNIKIKNHFFVVPHFEFKVDGILGMDFLRALEAKLDYKNATISFKYQDEELEFGLAGLAKYNNIPARCEKTCLIKRFGMEDCVVMPGGSL